LSWPSGGTIRATMKPIIRAKLDDVQSEDKTVQGKAFFYLIEVTDRPVGWAYDVWDEIVNSLRSRDNRQRAIAAQVLSNLAKSDPQQRILKDFDALLEVTRDEKFVTARHCMQSIWKVGAAGAKQQTKLVDGLALRFKECVAEKNCTLIRYDILQSLRRLYDVVKDEAIREKAIELMETEEDLKYRRKYSSLWRDK